jgi:hypothetical protein
MSDFFEDIVNDADKLEQKFLGPDYNYYSHIRNPSELGMSGKGNLKALSNDIAGIMDYVEVLVSGTGPASSGKPLGDKFFIKTAGQCKDYKTNKLVNRSMFINNIPTKKIPIISNLSGMSFPDFRGIVPGMVENIYDINPLKMFSAFMEGNEPLCAEVKLDTVGTKESSGSGFVPIKELKDLESIGKIPKGTVTDDMKKSLNNIENFVNIIEGFGTNYNYKNKTFTNSNIENIYLFSFTILLSYITYKLLHK